jgi:hypothetical protein
MAVGAPAAVRIEHPLGIARELHRFIIDCELSGDVMPSSPRVIIAPS